MGGLALVASRLGFGNSCVVCGTDTRYPYLREAFANLSPQANLRTRGRYMMLYVGSAFAKGFARFCVSYIMLHFT